MPRTAGATRAESHAWGRPAASRRVPARSRGRRAQVDTFTLAGSAARRRIDGRGRPARRLHRDQEGRRRGRAQSHPPPPERGAARRSTIAPAADHDYVLMARREALTRRFRRAGGRYRARFAQVGRDRPPERRTNADRRNRQRPATMKSEDSRNLILAIALSVLVLIGWNYFFGAPQLQKRPPGRRPRPRPRRRPAPAPRRQELRRLLGAARRRPAPGPPRR